MNLQFNGRFLLFLAFAVWVAPSARAATPQRRETSGVRYFARQSVESGFAKDAYLYPAGESNFSIITARRDHGGDSELHARDTDIFYVVDGSATFVTGGRMIGARQISPVETRGSGVQGGKIWQLSKGDVIVIPAGTPHWFKQVSSTVRYFVVKVREDQK